MCSFITYLTLFPQFHCSRLQCVSLFSSAASVEMFSEFTKPPFLLDEKLDICCSIEIVHFSNYNITFFSFTIFLLNFTDKVKNLNIRQFSLLTKSKISQLYCQLQKSEGCPHLRQGGEERGGEKELRVRGKVCQS